MISAFRFIAMPGELGNTVAINGTPALPVFSYRTSAPQRAFDLLTQRPFARSLLVAIMILSPVIDQLPW